MYTRLYNYLQENKILYSKQFGSQTGLSTDHAIIQLTDQIYENFEENKYTLAVFMDLAKFFDTVGQKILLGKMEIYGIGGITLKWSEHYLANRKQYIQISNIKKTDLKCVIWGYWSLGINIRSSIIFDTSKRPTICFKFVRPHYVRW